MRRLDEAVGGLKRRAPELSAGSALWPWQRRALAAAVTILCVGVLLSLQYTLVALLALLVFSFLCIVVLRSVALWNLLSATPGRMPREPSVPAPSLPAYTVLVPLFRETSVMPQLLAALRALDYPRDRLEVIFVVESVDRETPAALCDAALDDHMRVLVVPDGEPRTKPRAVQYALQFAVGELVVIYDAEDIPEPDQLRRAVAAMAAGGERVGCLQAHLNIYNTEASWLTRGIMAQTPLRL